MQSAARHIKGVTQADGSVASVRLASSADHAMESPVKALQELIDAEMSYERSGRWRLGVSLPLAAGFSLGLWFLVIHFVMTGIR